MKIATVHDLTTQALRLRTSCSIRAVPAAIYSQFVLLAAEAAAALSTLTDQEEDFLRACCKGVQGLGTDLDREVFLPAQTLYRLSCYVPKTSAPADGEQGTDTSDPPRKRRSKRRPKQDPPADETVTDLVDDP